jgi:hypothetical protein
MCRRPLKKASTLFPNDQPGRGCGRSTELDEDKQYVAADVAALLKRGEIQPKIRLRMIRVQYSK